MKIIKVGKKVDFEVTKQCQKCDTIFKIELVDTRQDSNGSYTWCPNCKKVIRVTSKQISKMMKRYGH